MSNRPHGKSRMNESLREIFAEMGIFEPCKLCSGPNWNVFHPPEKPCPKEQTRQIENHG